MFLGLHEFDNLKNPEVNYFRWRMKGLNEEMSRSRASKTWLDQLCIQFPPRIDPRLSHSVTGKLRDGNICLSVKYPNLDVRTYDSITIFNENFDSSTLGEIHHD